jgi:hypothetical protein
MIFKIQQTLHSINILLITIITDIISVFNDLKNLSLCLNNHQAILRRSTGIAPCSSRFTPWGKSQLYELDRRLRGLHSRSGRGDEYKDPVPAGNRTSVVQPVTSYYTEMSSGELGRKGEWRPVGNAGQALF